jgi:hypothetical protein
MRLYEWPFREDRRDNAPADLRSALALGCLLGRSATFRNTRSKLGLGCSAPTSRAISTKRFDWSGSSSGSLGLRGIMQTLTSPPVVSKDRESWGISCHACFRGLIEVPHERNRKIRRGNLYSAHAEQRSIARPDSKPNTFDPIPKALTVPQLLRVMP